MIHSLQNDIILDSQDKIFFSRQLEKIKEKTYDVLYGELKAPRFIPVKTDGGEGTEKITYRQYDMVGAAKVIANYATDFKRVDILGKESTAHVKSIGDSYGYTVQDIRAARQANLNLEQRRANTAMRVLMQLENSIAFFGDANNNLDGFFSNPNVPEAAVPADGNLAGTNFESKSPDQIIRDVNKLINDILINTAEVEKANAVLFPTSTWAYLTATPRSANSDTTIAAFLKANHPEITTWDTLVELETAGPGNTKMMVAYNKSEDKLTLEIPVPAETFPPQLQGLEYNVILHERIGGVLIYYPLSINKAYGI